METFIVKSGSLELTFEKEFGKLVGLSAPNQQWDILDRPHLGRNWELLLPLEGRRNNLIYGYKQPLRSFTVSEDGSKAELHWSSLTSEYGGTHDIDLTVVVEAIGDAIVWRTRIDNRDTRTVENVCAPIIGDTRKPKDAPAMRAFFSGYYNANDMCINPYFYNNKGYWGVDVPTQLDTSAPAFTPYYIIKADNDMGLYIAPYEEVGQLMTWRHRQFPGSISQYNMRIPEGDFIGGQECYMPFDVVAMPFLAGGQSIELVPVHLQAYSGDWTVGVDIYNKNRDRQNWKQPQNPAWADEPHSWLQLHINSPEDELRLRYTELPKVAEECVKHGIKAIQLVGWNKGGQDQGNPSHDTDDRLGTWQELKDAIAQCQSMGVKIILFAKFTFVDTGTEWYRKELHQFDAVDLNGVKFNYGGYQYQTITQLMDVNTKRFRSLCFLSDELREILKKEFVKLVELGADGMLYDESHHHGGVLFCFADNHGHRPGEFFYKNDLKLIEEFRALAPKDFLFCGENCADIQFQQYNMSYYRTFSPDPINVKRYMRPKDTRFMIAVTGFNDRPQVNLCLLFGYIASYEPFYFKGMPGDFPLTMEYARQMDALRQEVREYVWDGTYLEKKGVEVSGEKGAHKIYSVFAADSGKRAVVIANYSDKEPLRVSVTVEKGKIARWKAIGGEWSTEPIIELPPYTAAVAVEE